MPDGYVRARVYDVRHGPSVNYNKAQPLDHGRTQLRDGAIFVGRTGDRIMVKRAKRAEGGTWMLAGDHDAWELMLMAADAVVIVVEVKWMGREL